MLVAEELRLLVADATLTEIGGRISISAGVCELQKGQSAYRWIADADKALYRAKRAGRNRVAGRGFALLGTRIQELQRQ
jgi:PleD family two-component response regulator